MAQLELGKDHRIDKIFKAENDSENYQVVHCITLFRQHSF